MIFSEKLDRQHGSTDRLSKKKIEQTEKLIIKLTLKADCIPEDAEALNLLKKALEDLKKKKQDFATSN